MNEQRALLANAWLRSRQGSWTQWLRGRQRPRNLPVAEAQHYVERYRALAADLATARRILPGSATTAALESLYANAHASIDRSRRQTLAALSQLFRRRIPAIMGALAPTILWIGLLFVLTTAAGYWLVSQYPDLVRLVASGKMIEEVESGHLWTDDIFNITPSSVTSVRILSNNIAVSLFAFCSGVFFGLGAFYITALNGLMFGALLAFTHQHGLDGDLLKFVVAHGPVEISVICIAAAAGTALGESLIRPSAPTRRESFQRTAGELGPALLACALLLVVCGFIEGFISPNPHVPFVPRAVIGFGYWIAMVLLLRGGLHAPPAAKL
jgi:uncharacterized membrane protein SpoIIM required for sporulation